MSTARLEEAISIFRLLHERSVLGQMRLERAKKKEKEAAKAVKKATPGLARRALSFLKKDLARTGRLAGTKKAKEREAGFEKDAEKTQADIAQAKAVYDKAKKEREAEAASGKQAVAKAAAKWRAQKGLSPKGEPPEAEEVYDAEIDDEAEKKKTATRKGAVLTGKSGGATPSALGKTRHKGGGGGGGGGGAAVDAKTKELEKAAEPVLAKLDKALKTREKVGTKAPESTKKTAKRVAKAVSKSSGGKCWGACLIARQRAGASGAEVTTKKKKRPSIEGVKRAYAEPKAAPEAKKIKFRAGSKEMGTRSAAPAEKYKRIAASLDLIHNLAEGNIEEGRFIKQYLAKHTKKPGLLRRGLNWLRQDWERTGKLTGTKASQSLEKRQADVRKKMWAPYGKAQAGWEQQKEKDKQHICQATGGVWSKLGRCVRIKPSEPEAVGLPLPTVDFDKCLKKCMAKCS